MKGVKMKGKGTEIAISVILALSFSARPRPLDAQDCYNKVMRVQEECTCAGLYVVEYFPYGPSGVAYIPALGDICGLGPSGNQCYAVVADACGTASSGGQRRPGQRPQEPKQLASLIPLCRRSTAQHAASAVGEDQIPR